MMMALGLTDMRVDSSRMLDDEEDPRPPGITRILPAIIAPYCG
jgi:hypothetical protein